MGKEWKQWQTLFFWAPKSLQMVTTALEIQAPCVPASNNELVLVGLTQSWVGPGVRFSLGIATTNLDSVLKSRGTLADKYAYSQSYGFSSSHVQMWELDHKEGWAPKNWCFQIVVREKTLRVPWTARRSNQSKEIGPEYSLEGLMLKLQYFGHLMWRTDSLEKTLMLGNIEGKRKREQQRIK